MVTQPSGNDSPWGLTTRGSLPQVVCEVAPSNLSLLTHEEIGAFVVPRNNAGLVSCPLSANLVPKAATKPQCPWRCVVMYMSQPGGCPRGVYRHLSLTAHMVTSG